MRRCRYFCIILALCELHWQGSLLADGSAPVDAEQVRMLIEQNRRLQDEVSSQGRTIDQLRTRMDSIDQSGAKNQQELQTLQDQVNANPAAAEVKPADGSERTLRISAEMGFAFFDSGSDGAFANGEFRIDDAKVFLDAQVWKDLFVHTELDLETRESSDSNFHLGEIYAELEEPDGKFNLRIGRMYEPFGEEYQVRGVMENPLISHSVSDIWGMDEGLEVYGQLGKWSYAAAVQDGGVNTLHNFHADKSVTARVGFEPAGWLRLSASAMRTGQLNSANDTVSAVWFAGGFFRALGPAATTKTFWANLGEFDAVGHWRNGYVKAAAGSGSIRRQQFVGRRFPPSKLLLPRGKTGDHRSALRGDAL